MKINKNSWHYKYARLIRQGPMPETLCGYVTGTFGLTLLVLFLVFLFFTLTIAPIMVFGFDYEPLRALGEGGLIMDFMMLFWGVIFLVIYLYNKCTENNNIFFEYLRAKKDKVCPLIEYEDKE